MPWWWSGGDSPLLGSPGQGGRDLAPDQVLQPWVLASVCGRVSSAMASRCWWPAMTVCKQWSHRWRRCARPLRWAWKGREGNLLGSCRWITSGRMCLPRLLGLNPSSALPCDWSSDLTSQCLGLLVFNYVKEWWWEWYDGYLHGAFWELSEIIQIKIRVRKLGSSTHETPLNIQCYFLRE